MSDDNPGFIFPDLDMVKAGDSLIAIDGQLSFGGDPIEGALIQSVRDAYRLAIARYENQRQPFEGGMIVRDIDLDE